MKKFLSVLAAALLGVTLMLSAPAAFAEEIDVPPAAVEDAANEAAPNTDAAPNPDQSADAEEDATATVSEAVAVWLGDYAAEILSAAGLIISGIIAMLFKKGLLPYVASALKSVGEKTKEVAEKSKEGMEIAASKVNEMSESCLRMADELSAMEAKINAANDKNAAIMAACVEMIGTLLLNLKLTVDQRAIVENALTEIKAKMEGGEGK